MLYFLFLSTVKLQSASKKYMNRYRGNGKIRCEFATVGLRNFDLRVPIDFLTKKSSISYKGNVDYRITSKMIPKKYQQNRVVLGAKIHNRSTKLGMIYALDM